MIEKTIDLGGEVVHYVDFEGQGRPIVLVHGLGGSHANWLAVGPRLATQRRVVAIDLPGFGRSPRSHRGANLEVMGEVLAQFIDAISDEPVHLMGNSMGGALSILEAAARPQRIKSAVLVCPALPPVAGTKPDPKFLATLMLACLPFGHRLLGRRAAKAGPRQMVHELMRLCCVDPTRVPAHVVEAHLELARSRPSRPWADRAFAEATRSVFMLLTVGGSFRRAIQSLKVPTLIVHGKLDRLVDVRASRAAVAMAPQIELAELSDIGHTPQMEAPEEFLALVDRWLARVDPSAEQPIDRARGEAS